MRPTILPSWNWTSRGYVEEKRFSNTFFTCYTGSLTRPGGPMFRLRSCFISALIVTFTFSLGAIAQQPSDQEIENKIDALLQQMTIEEKVGQLTQFPNNSPKTLEMTREGKVGSLLGVLGVKDTNDAQKAALDSRLKIPLIFGYDVIHGYRTIFPVPIAEASSFDMATIEQAERIAAKESTASGIKWVFTPMLDIARDPRWGRMVEGSGEDPYLGSMVAVAKIKGLQAKSM